MNIMTIRSTAAGAGLAAVGLVALLLPAPTAAAPRLQAVHSLTLARVDRHVLRISVRARILAGLPDRGQFPRSGAGSTIRAASATRTSASTWPPPATGPRSTPS